MKSNKNSKLSFLKTNKFKFSTISTVIIVVFMIGLIAVNILASILSDRFTSLSIDLTSSLNYTISDKNREYIKKIDKPVKIILTCTEDYYLSNYASDILQYYSYTANVDYFKQTIRLLKDYKKINSNLEIEMIDAASPAFNEYRDRYSGVDISIGDIIVDYTYTDEDNKQKTKYKLLDFEDLYVIESSSDSGYSSGSSGGTVTGSSVETAVTSALYYVIKEQKDTIAVVKGYSSYSASDYSDFFNMLELNGYDYKEVSLQTENIPKDATMVMLLAPTLDFSEDDIKKLDEFLLGSGNNDNHAYGKSLIYFASNEQSDIPNLDGFLEEWGIEPSEGTLYETDAGYHATSSNTYLSHQDAGSDYTKGINSSLGYFSDNNRPFKTKFESSGKYNVYEILKTHDSCVVKPSNNNAWNPDSENTSSYSSVVLSRFVTENPEKENDPRFSNVLAVSSMQFISSENINAGYLANGDLALSLINTCANRVEDNYNIDTKTIDTASFTPTAVQSYTMLIICAVVIPVLVIIMGVVLYVIRKRR